MESAAFAGIMAEKIAAEKNWFWHKRGCAGSKKKRCQSRGEEGGEFWKRRMYLSQSISEKRASY